MLPEVGTHNESTTWVHFSQLFEDRNRRRRYGHMVTWYGQVSWLSWPSRHQVATVKYTGRVWAMWTNKYDF